MGSGTGSEVTVPPVKTVRSARQQHSELKSYRGSVGGSSFCRLSPPPDAPLLSLTNMLIFLHVLILFLWMSWCLRLLSCGVTDGYLLYMCWTIVTMHSTSSNRSQLFKSFITLALSLSFSLAGAKRDKKKRKCYLFPPRAAFLFCV